MNMLLTGLFELYSVCGANPLCGFGAVAQCSAITEPPQEQAAAAVLMSKLLDTSALAYLRRRSLCSLRRRGEQILSSPPKKKNTEHPNGYSVLQVEISACFEPCSRRATTACGVWHFVLCCDKIATLAEQLCLPRWKASFPTRLRCVICAATRSASDGAVAANLSFSAKK